MSTAEDKLARIDELFRTGPVLQPDAMNFRIREILNEDKFVDTNNVVVVRLEISDSLTRTWQQVRCEHAEVSRSMQDDLAIFTLSMPGYTLTKRVGV